MHRSVLRGLLLISIAVGVLIALYKMPKLTSTVHPPNDDPWVLTSYEPDNKYGTYLSNGFISTRIMGDGVGSQDGRPLPCFMAGLYDNEKLIAIPTWSDLRFYDGKTQFKIDKDAPYKQTLNMKTGILTTEATWRAGGKTLTGKIEVIVSRAEPGIGAVLAMLTPSFDGELSIIADTEDTSGSLRVAHWELIPEKPGLPNTLFGGFMTGRGVTSTSGSNFAIAACLGSQDSFMAGTDQPGPPRLVNEVRVNRGAEIPVFRYVSVATGTDQASALEAAISRLKSVLRMPTTEGERRRWNNLLEARKLADNVVLPHKAAWAKLWQEDIIIDGPRKDQQAIHSCMFYLLESASADGWSIPPMGLSSNAFSGHVFWDADVWMFPALLLQHPDLARSIPDYRYQTLDGAMLNAKADGFAGAQYAWESGSTGREDTPTGLVYRNERHIDGDVALAQWQYYLATGDSSWLNAVGYPVIKATADYWVSRAKFVPGSNRYEILQVVPPDENAELVNNSAYTNAIARINLQIAEQASKVLLTAPNPKWSQVADKLYIPYDASKRRFVAFDKYKGMQAKQADTELLAYPLQFTLPGRDMQPIYKNTFDFYAPKVFRNGPAMISSAHSVILARLGDTDKAYAAFVKSYKPFLRGPFNYFNEKPSMTYDNTCFLTGAAGPISAVLYGFAGTCIDYFPSGLVAAQLQFKPCLPRQWKSLKVTGIHWRGKNFDVTVSAGNKIRVTPSR